MGHLTSTSGGEFSWGTPQLALSVTPHERPVARAGSGGLSHSVTDLDVAEPCIASRCAVRARNRRLDPTTGSHLFTLGDRRWSPATRAAPPICAAAPVVQHSSPCHTEPAIRQALRTVFWHAGTDKSIAK